MRTGKYFVVCLSIVFLLAGVYVIQESVRHSGHYAEEGILVGALLSALALAAMFWSIKLHLVMKALERHMKGRSSERP
ncbi:MAG: hypothetical protein DMG54_27035 [Acidobacteria bacterium]|nr:MAG: hypothetical protein DMG54_27035 [Acidobacteriota bacterium]PYU56854.1 MAG: hypothetical protein DMG55_22140 [Acidobacteriota bacterium]PYU74260.1 MAG: hypothetical protein DMG52_12345 [Acidobacteriota bacterium]